MRRSRQTKIVATLGPATSSEEVISRLLHAGTDLFRFNFSHGTHEEHAERLRIVRALEERMGRPIGVFADLQGPKLRIGQFADKRILLETDDRFRLDLSEEPGSKSRVHLPHPEVFASLHPGARLLLDDGRVHLEVISSGPDFADTRVLVGGALSNNKGLNLPDVTLDASPLTDKDRRDLEFALDMGMSLIALSFVQRPEDIEEAVRLIRGRAQLIAKLEKPSAVDQLEKIVDRASGVMVARGDLGVELPPETVPAIQKRIISTCRQAGKPVIVATQMLDSMVKSPTPTRAEASDVANAVYEGADGVMLSAETAVGQHPVHVVDMMDRIIKQTESDPAYAELLNASQVKPRNTMSDTIMEGARQASVNLAAAAIVTYTTSGATALRAARKRPPVPLLALTPSLDVARNLAGVWGVHAVHVDPMDDYEAMETLAVRIATESDFARNGDMLVITAGLPLETSGVTNLMRLVRVERNHNSSPVRPGDAQTSSQ